MIIEKDGQIIVTELRPMSELMLKNDFSLSVLGYLSKEKRFERIRQSSEAEVYACDSCKFLHISNFDGYIPLPIYQPEQETGPDRTKPPCLECGAQTAKEAEKKCICAGDKDYCHGNDLWG